MTKAARQQDGVPASDESMRQLLDAHLARFNLGVETGNWGPMLAHFTAEAELIFRGVPAGPFIGRDAIAAAYTSQPPDDIITTIKVLETTSDSILARYGWSRDANRTTGSLRLERNDTLIRRLTIAFDPERA